jgi:hypothetical protein
LGWRVRTSYRHALLDHHARGRLEWLLDFSSFPAFGFCALFVFSSFGSLPLLLLLLIKIILVIFFIFCYNKVYPITLFLFSTSLSSLAFLCHFYFFMLGRSMRFLLFTLDQETIFLFFSFFHLSFFCCRLHLFLLFFSSPILFFFPLAFAFSFDFV